jgi:hypothetical protein
MTTDSDGAIASLRRWELFGGRWRVLARTESVVTLALLTCDGGQEMSQVTAMSADLDAFLDSRSAATPGSPGVRSGALLAEHLDGLNSRAALVAVPDRRPTHVTAVRGS